MIKKLIYIIIIIIISIGYALANTQNAYVDYNGYEYAFKPGDSIKFAKNADKNIKLFEKSQTEADKQFYLQEALRYYFLLSKIQPGAIDAHIGLGRIYDEMKLDRLAKKHFFIAYNLDSKNSKNNFYFAEYYYKRNEYINSLNYYKTAAQNGYSNNYILNCRLGSVYEKLADIETSKKFYQKALQQNKTSMDLINKIHLLDDLNYTQSQYYLFNK